MSRDYTCQGIIRSGFTELNLCFSFPFPKGLLLEKKPPFFGAFSSLLWRAGENVSPYRFTPLPPLAIWPNLLFEEEKQFFHLQRIWGSSPRIFFVLAFWPIISNNSSADEQIRARIWQRMREISRKDLISAEWNASSRRQFQTEAMRLIQSVSAHSFAKERKFGNNHFCWTSKPNLSTH